jgi:hypothetical protein
MNEDRVSSQLGKEDDEDIGVGDGSPISTAR